MRRLSGLDAVFLTAEGAANYVTHGMAVMVLDPSTMPAGDRLLTVRDYVRERIQLVPPLQRRLVQVPLGLDVPRWAVDPRVDIDYHIRAVALPAPVTSVALSSFVSDLAERKLDRRFPLWEMYVVEGFEGDRVCIVAKLHHSLMDGGAGMQFMASLFALKPGAPPPPAPAPQAPESRPGDLAMLAGSLTSLIRRPLLGARALQHTFSSGIRVASRLVDHGRNGAAPLALPFSAPRTTFDKPLTPRREIAFTSLSLDKIKDVAHAFEVTVNDVVLAIMAGAMRRFLASSGELPETQLVAAVPLSVRGDQGTEQANLVTIMLTGLAIDVEDPVARLDAIHHAALEAKLVQSAMGSDLLTEWLDVPMPLVFSLATRLYSRLRLCSLHPPFCNVLVSDVPGPPVSLYFAGARLESIFPLGPIFDGVGLNITAISSADKLDVGLVACPDRRPDLWSLASQLEPALEELDAERLAPAGAKARSEDRRARSPGPPAKAR
jgi:diacylglycerol O-acyltransferase / wax synthase